MRPLVQGYDELKLRIDPSGGGYRVHASTGSAEVSTSFELPFSELEIENFILKVSRPRGRRRIENSAAGEARRFGGALFRALFRDQTFELYREALSRARSQGRGVRITLCLSGAPELIDVPWEYLFDEPDFLAVSAFTPVVRYLDLPRAHRPLLVEPPLRLLGVVSSPADHERLDVERERENLARSLSGLTATGAIELDWLERPTLGALLKALQTQTYHALHYIGHGTYDRDAEQGFLLFEDDSGWARPVSGDKLGTILHDFSSLRLAVLNACEGARSARSDPFAGVAGALVRRDIPAVVAMQFEISDEAAIVFADGFYRPLAAGVSVDASLAAARLAMFAERADDIEWGTPVLFMRVPDGRIFDLEPDGGEAVLPAPAASVPPSGNRAQRTPGTVNVVINYRRPDTAGHALLLADQLRRHFGSENVRLSGDDTPEADRSASLEPDGALLVLVGRDWVSSLKAATSARHSDDPSRGEIERALRDRPQSVVPVLIDAPMPHPDTLPRSLRALSRRESTELRHASFERDLGDLIARVQRMANGTASPPAAATRTAGMRAQTSDRPRPTLLSPAAAKPRIAAGVPQPYPDHFAEVISGLVDGTVVPVLGLGVARACATEPVLATPLAEELHTSSGRLAEAAQRVAVTLGERRLYAAIKEVVAAHAEPNEVHRFLAELPGRLRERGLSPRPQLIINANYDSGLERAFEDANEPFDYAVYLEENGWFVHVPWGEHDSEPVATTIREPKRYVEFPIDDDGELERTIIVKIHGGADGGEGGVAWRNNYVVTEDHYIDYLPTDNIQDHLPIQILDKLSASRCLFLGYLLSNWNARVFLRRIWRGRPMSESSWAIEEHPDPLETASWRAVGRVELLAAGLTEYVTGLQSALGRGDG